MGKGTRSRPRRQVRPKRGGRNGRLRRALGLIFYLASRHFGATVAEMIEETGAARRTVYRDLSALKEAGIRFNTERAPSLGRSSRWRLIGLPTGFERLAERTDYPRAAGTGRS